MLVKLFVFNFLLLTIQGCFDKTGSKQFKGDYFTQNHDDSIQCTYEIEGNFYFSDKGVFVIQGKVMKTISNWKSAWRWYCVEHKDIKVRFIGACKDGKITLNRNGKQDAFTGNYIENRLNFEGSSGMTYQILVSQ